MTLEQIEQTYKKFVEEIKTNAEWTESGYFIHDVLSFYNIKIPKAIYKCETVRSDGSIRGYIASGKQLNSVFNAINKLKEVTI